LPLYGDDISRHYQISAVGRRGQDGNICEFTALVTYSIGVQCHLHTAEDDGLHAGFTILGSIEFTLNPWLSETQANPFTVSLYEQPSEVIDVEVVHVEAKGNGFYYQVEVVLDALQSKQYTAPRPLAQLADSHDVMGLLTDWHQAALESSATNNAIEI
jgi:hypothetical protein